MMKTVAVVDMAATLAVVGPSLVRERHHTEPLALVDFGLRRLEWRQTEVCAPLINAGCNVGVF